MITLSLFNFICFTAAIFSLGVVVGEINKFKNKKNKD